MYTQVVLFFFSPFDPFKESNLMHLHAHSFFSSFFFLIFQYFTVAAKEIAELPGFYVRIIPTASFLFNVSKMNLSTRNNVRAYTKGEIWIPVLELSNCCDVDKIVQSI
jgi:hypothetical protein